MNVILILHCFFSGNCSTNVSVCDGAYEVCNSSTGLCDCEIGYEMMNGTCQGMYVCKSYILCLDCSFSGTGLYAHCEKTNPSIPGIIQ